MNTFSVADDGLQRGREDKLSTLKEPMTLLEK